MSLDSIVIEIIEMVILNIFHTVQLTFAFFFFSHERALNVSTASFSGQCKQSSIFLPSQKPKEHFAL